MINLQSIKQLILPNVEQIVSAEAGRKMLSCLPWPVEMFISSLHADDRRRLYLL